MSWLKAGMSFLPSLGGIWLYLAVALVSASLASVGTYKVEHWRSLASIAVLQTEYDQYKLQVAIDANGASQKSLDALMHLQRSLTTIQGLVQKQSQLAHKTSDALIERLTNANGKSCPLSPAVVEYLDSLRRAHSTPGN